MKPVRDIQQVAETLRRRRKELRLTQQDVALSAGVNRRAVSEIERGMRSVRLDNLLAVTTALGLDLEFRARGGEDA